MRNAALAVAAACCFLACAHRKPAGPTDRVLLPEHIIVRVPEVEAWELASVIEPAQGDSKKLELLPSGRRLIATPVRVRSAEPADLVVGATIFWTTEAKDGDVERLRKADWQRGTIKRIVGTTVLLGNGQEADGNWHVLVPLVADGAKADAEPSEPK